jgi:hypothetical protein
MIDLKFIQFFLSVKYNKTLEEYYSVQNSTVSNWRKRGVPNKYITIFVDREKSNNIYELFKLIY